MSEIIAKLYALSYNGEHYSPYGHQNAFVRKRDAKRARTNLAKRKVERENPDIHLGTLYNKPDEVLEKVEKARKEIKIVEFRNVNV